MSGENNFFSKVYENVKKIPEGAVASYGYIAALCGCPGAARQVGWALHVNSEPGTVPCHRVVTKDGRVSSAFAFGGANVQVELLKKEGVGFDENGLVKRRFFVGETV
jgi:methylated-DNA-protein-cysteine methyltransferase-like protein